LVDLRQLQLLRALGDLGSVTAVAESVRLTPSAVSQQLKALQRGSPVPLTTRENRRLVLTAAGERLAAAAAEVDTALARAEVTLRDLAQTPQGVVSVAAFNSAAWAFFPSLVKAFPTNGPVTVTVTDEDTLQSDFPRLANQYDIVIAHRFEHTPLWPPTVHAVTLLNEPLDVALPAGHRLAGGRTVTATDAAHEPWITTHEGWPVGAVIEALAAVAGRPVTIRHRVNEFTVVSELVRVGAGLALFPRWTTPPPRGVVLRRLVGVRASRRIDALSRPENAIRPAVQSVLTELHRVAGALASAQMQPDLSGEDLRGT
jgi:DNA-binding transcriptional LysR family regulator